MKLTHSLKPRLAAILFLTFALPASAMAGVAASARTVLVEAEQFAQRGGWVVDPQFMDRWARRTCWRTASASR